MGEHKRKKKKRRTRISKSKVTAVILIVGFIAIFGIDYMQRSGKSGSKKIDQARSKGNPEAKLKITEYIDFQCSHCAQGYLALKTFFSLYPDEIFLQMRYFPLRKNSELGAVYAQCAAHQDKFWPLHDLLLAKQDHWRNLPDPRSFFDKLSVSAGLNASELKTCLDKGEAKRAVLREKAYGETLFIKSTPTYFINGERVVGIKSLRRTLESYFENTN